MTLRAMWDALSVWPSGLRLWGEAVSDACDGPSSAVPGTKRSVTVDGGDLQLVGDEDAPAAGRVYGTDSEGVRGWHAAGNLVLLVQSPGGSLPSRPEGVPAGLVWWLVEDDPEDAAEDGDVVINASGTAW